MGKYTSKYTGQEIDDRLDAVSGKQDTLVSGTNIKTINGTSLLGSGNIAIEVEPISNAEIEALFVEVTLISFTIAGTSYQAESGMTWDEWCSSTYNTSGYISANDKICTANGLYMILGVVPSDAILANTTYRHTSNVSGGGAANN